MPKKRFRQKYLAQLKISSVSIVLVCRFFLFIFLSCSCAARFSQNDVYHLGHTDHPQWLDQQQGAIEQEGRLLFVAVGFIEGIQNEVVASTTAVNKARTEMVKILKPFFRLLVENYLSDKLSRFDTTALSVRDIRETWSSQLLAVVLPSITIQDTWRNRGDVTTYVLACLDLEAVLLGVAKASLLTESFRDYVKEHAEDLHRQYMQQQR